MPMSSVPYEPIFQTTNSSFNPQMMQKGDYIMNIYRFSIFFFLILFMQVAVRELAES